MSPVSNFLIKGMPCILWGSKIDFPKALNVKLRQPYLTQIEEDPIMINSFVESTIWKRTANFGARSLLNLAYCLIMVLGGILIANESQAQKCETTVSLGDRVIVQNARSFRNVREEPNTKPDTKIIGKVYNNYTGTVMQDSNWDNKYIEEDDTYIWYYVEWDDLGERGWSAGITDEQPHDSKYIFTLDEAKQKDAIVQALFNCENYGESRPGYITADQTKHDYNDYGCNADTIYGGNGHAGWDVRTKDELPADQVFFSLTEGQLLTIPKDGKTDYYNTIAVYDPIREMTTLYLHAKIVLARPDKKNKVYVGQPLGIQGEVGITIDTKPHVHIEVQDQEGGSKIPASSAGAKPTINPIPYLYYWVTHRTGEGVANGREEGLLTGREERSLAGRRSLPQGMSMVIRG